MSNTQIHYNGQYVNVWFKTEHLERLKKYARQNNLGLATTIKSLFLTKLDELENKQELGVSE